MQSDSLLQFAGSALFCKASGIAVSEDIAARLKAFMASDGTFQSSVGSKETSTQNTRLALEVLAIFAADISPNALDSFANSVLPLLPQGDDETTVNPALLSPLSKISSKKPRVMGTRLVAVAESLLHLRHSDSLETLSDVLESLYFVMTYKASPVFINLRSPTIRAEDFSKTLVVDVFDIFGSAAAVESVEVRSIKRSGRDTVLYQGVLEGNSLDLSAIDGIVPGLFAADLSVTVAGQPKAITKTVAFVIQGKLEVVDVSIGASTSKQLSVSELTSVSGQNSVDDLSASAARGDFVHIAFGLIAPTKSGERFQKPHQVFVKFTHEASGVGSQFVGAADGKLGDGAGSKYRATVSLSKESETFAHISGKYMISLLVSDVAYGSPIEWVVGSIDIAFPVKIIKESPLYAKPLMFTSDNTLKALPEIQHVMRPESKRASAFMATIFTVLALAPLVLFIGFVLHLGPNLKRLQSVSSVLFVVCLLVTLFLYGGYWLALEGVSFYDTIKYLCFLVPITIVIGSSAVNSVAETRMGESKKKDV